MEWWEVNRYNVGLQRRYRAQWETTRALQWWLANMFRDPKKSSSLAKPEDMYKFGWEEEEEKERTSEPKLTEEDAKDMQELIESWKW
jgi:hypothetical protein